MYSKHIRSKAPSNMLVVRADLQVSRTRLQPYASLKRQALLEFGGYVEA